jgi:hypothetical protein
MIPSELQKLIKLEQIFSINRVFSVDWCQHNMEIGHKINDYSRVYQGYQLGQI